MLYCPNIFSQYSLKSLHRACVLTTQWGNETYSARLSNVFVYASQRFNWVKTMTRRSLRGIATSLVLFAATGLVANDPATVFTHTLTVQEKLELLETIEITSEKELQPVKEDEKDPAVEEILDEISQLESDSDSSE